MGKDKAYPQSTAISKAAPREVEVSDYRRQTKTFGLVAQGVRSRADIVEATSALFDDYASGKITAQDVAVYCNILDRNLHTKDQELQAMELGLRVEMLKRKAKDLDKKG